MPKPHHHTLLPSSIFFLLILCSAPALHAQQLAVKTNGLMLAAMAPNIGCEFVVGERSDVYKRQTSHGESVSIRVMPPAPESRSATR